MRWTGHNAAIYTVAGWMLHAWRIKLRESRRVDSNVTPTWKANVLVDRRVPSFQSRSTIDTLGVSSLAPLSTEVKNEKETWQRCLHVGRAPPSVSLLSPSLRYAFCARNDTLSVYLSRISNNQSSREVDLRGVTKFVQRSSPINHSTVEASRQVYR